MRRLLVIGHVLTMPWLLDACRRAGDVRVVHVPRNAEPGPPDGHVDEVVSEQIDAPVLTDPARALAILTEAHCRQPFDGVLTLWDPAVPFTARLARHLGLPGVDVHAADIATDKARLREAMKAGGLPVPGFVAVDRGARVEDLLRAFDREGVRFPVVLKPAAGYSSAGVVRVDSPEDLPAGLAATKAASLGLAGAASAGGLVAEEFVSGPEYAVELVVIGSEAHVLCVGYKGCSTGPYFEEGVYIAEAPLPAEMRTSIGEVCARVLASIGVADGPAHVELRLDEQRGRRPVVLDVGLRVGGSGVSHFIVRSATGYDFLGAAIDIATGVPPARPDRDRARRGAGVAANFIIPQGGSGTLTSIDGMVEVSAHPDVRQVIELAQPGDLVSPYPNFSGYPGFVLSTHRDYEAATDFHRWLGDAVRPRYAPPATKHADAREDASTPAPPGSQPP